MTTQFKCVLSAPLVEKQNAELKIMYQFVMISKDSGRLPHPTKGSMKLCLNFGTQCTVLGLPCGECLFILLISFGPGKQKLQLIIEGGSSYRFMFNQHTKKQTSKKP